MTFPPHKCGLYLTHNEHKDDYESLNKYLDDRPDDYFSLSPEDKAACLATNELWVLQWYPHTPIGSYSVAGPTLENVLEQAADPEYLK